MSNAVSYKCIDKYHIQAKCREPIHVGSASGDKGEVLLHPVDNIPFIQATSICGVFRNYCDQIYNPAQTNSLFGSHEDDKESRVKFSDGTFMQDENLHIELRPRVRIDNATGTVTEKKLQGNDGLTSGQKFDMQYVSSGARFSFDIFLYGGTPEENDTIKKCLAALKAGEIQFGGQKSNGCGYIDITKVEHKQYDMTKGDERKLWYSESGLEEIKLSPIKDNESLNAYEIIIQAATESELLVKGIAVDDFGKDAPKATNIRNAKKDFIIPGSSFKGSIKNRMEMIAGYMGVNELIIDGFGKTAKVNEEGMSGNLKFRDIIIKKGKDNQFLRTRIRIDKFTGGVVNGGLFTEMNVAGDLDITINIADKNNPDAVAALLLLAVRDLGYKLYALGSGQNVGKGYIDIKSVTIRDVKRNETCELDNSFSISGMDTKLIDRCMRALKEARTQRRH